MIFLSKGAFWPSTPLTEAIFKPTISWKGWSFGALKIQPNPFRGPNTAYLNFPAKLEDHLKKKVGKKKTFNILFVFFLNSQKSIKNHYKSIQHHPSIRSWQFFQFSPLGLRPSVGGDNTKHLLWIFMNLKKHPLQVMVKLMLKIGCFFVKSH